MIKNNRQVAQNAAEIFEQIRLKQVDKQDANALLKALEVMQKSYLIDLMKDKQGIIMLPSEDESKEGRGMVRKIS